MQRLLAILSLTWKAAFRFRLFWVLCLLLVGAVVLLPLILKDDGTARGFTQILLTYTLGTITALLGLATLWLSCGTLARDIEENQIQLVVVKPIARWEIWLGKWLGILSLNAVLLMISGGCVFGLLHWRAQRLPAREQTILKNEVLVARGSLKEAPTDFEAITERIFQQRIRETPVSPASQPLVRKQIEEQVKAQEQVVRPNEMRRWKIDFGVRRNLLRDQPLFARLKFHAASTNTLGTYFVRMEVGPPDSPVREAKDLSLAANTFHEIQLPPNLWDANGTLTIDVQNRDGVALLFPLEDGMEVLYREGSFALNFARALAIVLCWLALLAALGLTSASFLSFPVAAFVSASLLVVGFSTGTLASAVESGTIMGVNEETGEAGKSILDYVLIPIFKGLLKVFNLVQGFSPIDALSAGRSITWGTLGLAFAQIVLLLGGIVGVIGIIVFTRRELASGQSNA